MYKYMAEHIEDFSAKILRLDNDPNFIILLDLKNRLIIINNEYRFYVKFHELNTVEYDVWTIRGLDLIYEFLHKKLNQNQFTLFEQAIFMMV